MDFSLYSCAHRDRRGFTLGELLVALAILATLAAIAWPIYGNYMTSARNREAMAGLSTLSGAITIFFVSNGAYPDSLADLGRGNFLDPWGNPYQYLRINGGDQKGLGKMRKDHNLVPVNTDYDLYSMGADGRSQPPFTAQASRDDIVRCNNGGYLGLASDY